MGYLDSLELLDIWKGNNLAVPGVFFFSRVVEYLWKGKAVSGLWSDGMIVARWAGTTILFLLGSSSRDVREIWKGRNSAVPGVVRDVGHLES